MMEPVLLTDLDNTMIYSYKRDIGVDKVEVEPYQGRIVSYMTRFSYEALKMLREDVLFVPVTTRSVQQYRRIAFDDEWTPEYALVSNGGTLLVNGAADQQWKAESLKLIEPCCMELEKAEQIMERDPHRTLDVRRVDGLFAFTKSEKPEESLLRLESELDLTRVELLQNGIKIYVIPRSLNKGAAAERLLLRLKSQREGTAPEVICAGDSAFDVSLLERGHVVFGPRLLCSSLQSGEIHSMEDGQILSDEVFGYLSKRI